MAWIEATCGGKRLGPEWTTSTYQLIIQEGFCSVSAMGSKNSSPEHHDNASFLKVSMIISLNVR